MLKRLFVFLINLYQLVCINKRPCCRFVPTCSEYALLAVKKHGAWRGLVLSLFRILRCLPFGKKGLVYDPVP